MKGRALELELVGGAAAPADALDTPFDPPQTAGPTTTASIRPGAAPSELWLAVHVPALALAALMEADTDADTTPRVAVTGSGTGQRIACGNEAAMRLGVETGMAIGAAHAIAGPALRVHERDERAEAALLERLGIAAMRYSATVSVAPPAALVVEIAGSLKLFGGFEALCARIEQDFGRRLAALGAAVSIAVAPTPAAAEAFARARRRVRITRHADLTGALGALPIEVLVRSEREAADLARIGARTIDACLRLPRSGLARRLSPRLLERLDRMTGAMPDPRPRCRLQERFDEGIDLPFATRRREPIVEGARRLLTRLDDYLAATCQVTQTLEWRLAAGNGPIDEFRMGLAQPSRPHPGQREAWAALFAERLASREIDAAVERLELKVHALARAETLPAALFSSPEDEQAERDADWAATLARLEARLGEAALSVPEVLAEHRPERAWRLRLPHAPAQGEARVPPGGARPLWLCHPARALTSDTAGRPFWRGPLALVSVRERIEAGWWEGGDSTRDYYVARNPAGEHCWVCRVLPRAGGTPSWYLQGIFE